MFRRALKDLHFYNPLRRRAMALSSCMDASRATTAKQPMRDIVYKINTSKRNFDWRLDNLQNSKGRAQARHFISQAQKLVSDEHVRTVLASIPGLQRNIFKDISNDGVVFIAKNPRDLGNYMYACFYDAAYRVARADCLPALEAFQALQARYPSLALHHPPTANSVELKADVMETLLSDSRLYCRIKETQEARAKVQAIFRGLNEVFEHLLKTMTCNNDGRPRLAAWSGPNRSLRHRMGFWFWVFGYKRFFSSVYDLNT